jgi:hypothetical protein
MPLPQSIDRAYFRKYILDRSEPIPESGCWFWSGALAGSNSYGAAWVDRIQWRAHRLSYTVFVGPIPEGSIVCHRCDIPHCVNPSHLFVGTNADNTRDMIDKGRYGCGVGEGHGMSRLTVADIISIRSRYAAGGITQGELAAEYATRRDYISQIVTRKRWASVQ